MKKKFFAILQCSTQIFACLLRSSLLYALSSCASLTSSEQIVSIDSPERGLSVYLKKKSGEQKIGETPFFYKLPRARQWTLVAKDAGKEQAYHFPCSFRWWEAGLGNVVWYWFAPLAYGYDIWSENAWGCKPYLKIPWQKSLQDSQPACQHFFVLPPFQKHQLEAFQLLEAWLVQAKKEQQGCHSFVEKDKVIGLYKRLNLGGEKNFDFHKLADHKKRKIGYATKANAFIQLEVQKPSVEEDNRLHLTAKAFDLHTQKEIEFSPKQVAIDRSHTDKQTSFWNFAFDLIPNSVSYESRVTSFYDAHIGQEKTSRKGILSDLLSLNLATVTSPEAYEDWDVSLSISPNFQFSYFEWEYNFDDGRRRVDWQLAHLMLAYEAKGTLYTAIGQFSLGVGFGPMLSFGKISGEKTRMYATFFKLSSVQYTFHLTREVFSYLQVSNMKPEKKVHNGTFVSGGFSETALGLGYFFSDASL